MQAHDRSLLGGTFLGFQLLATLLILVGWAAHPSSCSDWTYGKYLASSSVKVGLGISGLVAVFGMVLLPFCGWHRILAVATYLAICTFALSLLISLA